MSMNYLVRELFEFMFVYELDQVHEFSEFRVVYGQPKFMRKVRVHEQNKFMYS